MSGPQTFPPHQIWPSFQSLDTPALAKIYMLDPKINYFAKVKTSAFMYLCQYFIQIKQ